MTEDLYPNYKGSLQLNAKKTNNPIKNWTKDFIRYLTKIYK